MQSQTLSSVRGHQEEEEEVAHDEELQEEQQVIETWTQNVKACTCDCESADATTRIPTAASPLLITPSPPQGHPWSCMPGEDSICCVRSNGESCTCSGGYKLPNSWGGLQFEQSRNRKRANGFLSSNLDRDPVGLAADDRMFKICGEEQHNLPLTWQCMSAWGLEMSFCAEEAWKCLGKSHYLCREVTRRLAI